VHVFVVKVRTASV